MDQTLPNTDRDTFTEHMPWFLNSLPPNPLPSYHNTLATQKLITPRGPAHLQKTEQLHIILFMCCVCEQPARLFCPWNFSGKNTENCHLLLQERRCMGKQLLYH